MKTFHLQIIAGRDRIATAIALLAICMSLVMPVSPVHGEIEYSASPVTGECESCFEPPSNGAPNLRRDAASR